MKLLKIILAVYLAAFMPDNGETIDREDINRRNIWKESQRISGLDKMRRRRLKVIEQLLKQDELNTDTIDDTFKITDKDINVVVNETKSPIKTVVDNILAPLLQDNTENTKTSTTTTTESNTETILFGKNDKSDFINIRDIQKRSKSSKPDMKSEATTLTLNKKEVLSIFPKANTNSRHSRRKKSNEYRIWLVQPKKKTGKKIEDNDGSDDPDDTVVGEVKEDDEGQKVLRYDDGKYEVSVSSEEEEEEEDMTGLDVEESEEEIKKQQAEREEKERQKAKKIQSKKKQKKKKIHRNQKQEVPSEAENPDPNEDKPLFVIKAFKPTKSGKGNFEIDVKPEDEDMGTRRVVMKKRYDHPYNQNWQNWDENDYQVDQQNIEPNVGQWPGVNTQQYYPQYNQQYQNQPFNNRPAQNQPFNNQPSQNQPFNNQPAQNQPFNNQPAQNQPFNNQPAQNQPFNNQPAQNQLFNNQPAHNQPFNNQQAQNQPFNNQPVQNQPFNNQPAQNQQFNNQPAQNQPFNEQPVHNQPFNKQPVQNPSYNNQPFNNQPAPQNFDNQRYNQQIPVGALYPNTFNQQPPTIAPSYPNQFHQPLPATVASYPQPIRRNNNIQPTPNNNQQMLNLNQQWNPNTPAYIQQQVWTQTTTTAVPITANPTVAFQSIPINHKQPTPNTNQQQWNNPQYQQQILYGPDIPHPMMLSSTTTTSKPITTFGPTPNPRIDHNGVPTREPTIQENLMNALKNTSKEKNFNINIHIHNDKKETSSTTESTISITERTTSKRKGIRRSNHNRRLSESMYQDLVKPTIYTPDARYYTRKRNSRERIKEENYETTEKPTFEDYDGDKYDDLPPNFKSITDSSDYSDISIPEDYLDHELSKEYLAKSAKSSEYNDDDFMAFSTFEFPKNLHKQNEQNIKESNAKRYANKLKQFLPYLIGRSKKLKGTNKEINVKLQKNIKEIYKLLRSIDNKNKTTIKETKNKDNAEDEKLARIDKFLEQMPILFNSSLESLKKLTQKVSEMSAEKKSSSESKNITDNNENYEPYNDEGQNNTSMKNNFYFPENSPDIEDNLMSYENPQNYNPNLDDTPTNLGPRNLFSKSDHNVNSFSPFSGKSFRKRRTRHPGYRSPIQNLIRHNINIENDPSLQRNNFPGIMRYSPKINLDPFLRQTRYNRYYPPGLPNRMNMRPGSYNYIPGGQRYAPNFIPQRSFYRSPPSNMGYGTSIEVKPTIATVMLNPQVPPTQNYNPLQQKQHLPPVYLNKQPPKPTRLRRIQRPIYRNNPRPQKMNHYQLPTIHLNSPQFQKNHQYYQPPTVQLPKNYQRPPLNLNPQQIQNIRRNYEQPRVNVNNIQLQKFHHNYPPPPVNLRNPQPQNQQNHQQPPVNLNNAQPNNHNQQKYQQVSAILTNPQHDKPNQQNYRPPITPSSTVGPSFFKENSFTREHSYRESRPPDIDNPEKYLNTLQTEPKRNNQQNSNPIDVQIERMKEYLKQYENKEITPEMLQQLNENPYVELIPCNKTEKNNNYKRDVSSTIATIINRTPGVTNYNNQYISSTPRDIIHIRGETEPEQVSEENSGSIEIPGNS